MALELSLKLKGEIRVGDRSQDQRVRHLHTFETRVMVKGVLVVSQGYWAPDPLVYGADQPKFITCSSTIHAAGSALHGSVPLHRSKQKWYAGSVGSTPSWGAKIPCASWPKKQKLKMEAIL